MTSIWLCPLCDTTFTSASPACPKDGSPSQRLGDPARLGQRIRNLELVEAIGSGSMGEVYRAKGLDGTSHAVKILTRRSSMVAVRRFLREAEISLTLRHPNLVAVNDYSAEEDGTIWLSMEFISGRNLNDVLRVDGALSCSRSFEIARQLASGLALLHSAGIVHRDMKPGNVMLLDGVPDRVKILDFGIAQVTVTEGEELTRLTRTGAFVGTPAYMSPEQLRGDSVGPATDIYSLGIVLYALLTGRLPWRAKGVKLLAERLQSQDPPELEDFEGLGPIVRKMLSQQVEDRPVDGKALEAILASSKLALPPARPVPQPKPLPVGAKTPIPGRGAVAASPPVLGLAAEATRLRPLAEPPRARPPEVTRPVSVTPRPPTFLPTPKPTPTEVIAPTPSARRTLVLFVVGLVGLGGLGLVGFALRKPIEVSSTPAVELAVADARTFAALPTRKSAAPEPLSAPGSEPQPQAPPAAPDSPAEVKALQPTAKKKSDPQPRAAVADLQRVVEAPDRELLKRAPNADSTRTIASAANPPPVREAPKQADLRKIVSERLTSLGLSSSDLTVAAGASGAAWVGLTAKGSSAPAAEWVAAQAAVLKALDDEGPSRNVLSAKLGRILASLRTLPADGSLEVYQKQYLSLAERTSGLAPGDRSIFLAKEMTRLEASIAPLLAKR